MKKLVLTSSMRGVLAVAAAALGLATLGAAPARADGPPAAPARSDGPPTREPSSHSWLYDLFVRMAARNRVRPAGYDRELSDSFTLTAVRPVRLAQENAPAVRPVFRWSAPVEAAPLPMPAPVAETASSAWDFSVPIVAPAAARVPGLEPLLWTAASAGSAQPSGLAASAAPTLNSTRGPVFSPGSTPASFGADGTAAAARAFGPAVAGAPSTRRSTAVVGPQPQAAGQQGTVDTTDSGSGTYLGPTYTVPSGGDAFDTLFDAFNQAGTVTHSSGTLTLAYYLILGYNRGSNGTYNMSGTGTINTPQTFVGRNGTGLFNQSGGTHNVGSSGLYFGYVSGGNGTYTLSGGTLSVTGQTSLGYQGTGVFTQSGGTATLAQLRFVGNASTASGTLNLNGGTLNVANIALGGTSGGTSTFNFNSGTLQPTSSNGTSFFPNVLTAANVRNSGAFINTNGFNVTVAQGLVHSTVGGDSGTDGGLTKNGTGTLTLSGANTYTGPTNVNAGTLLVNGTSSGTGLVTVQNSASLLGGTGTISAAVSVTTGTLNPGNNTGANGSADNAGKLTVGALTLSSTAASVFDISSGTTYDQLFANGNVALGGSTLTLNVTSSTTAYTIGQVLDLFHNNSGTLTGTFSNFANNGLYTYGGDTFRANYTASDFTLTVTAVPEPATWLAGALLVTGAGWTLRRRLRRA